MRLESTWPSTRGGRCRKKPSCSCASSIETGQTPSLAHSLTHSRSARQFVRYALDRQATDGPCDQPKPWGWNVVENAKYQSWKQLGGMSQNEAMRLYVRTMEEEIGDESKGWWSSEDLLTGDLDGEGHAEQSDGGEGTAEDGARGKAGEDAGEGDGAGPGAGPGAERTKGAKRRSVAEVLVEGSWVSPYIDDSHRPTPRYEHSMALMGSKAYLVGGNYAGRYISDTWCLDLEKLAWSQVVSGSGGEGQGTVPPPSAGHAAVVYNASLLLVGGHERLERVKGKVKSFSPMRVYSLDPIARAWSEWATTGVGEDGERPMQRGGHTASLIGGSKLYMFGGENPNRKPCNELWVLDLKTNEWSKPEVSGEAPLARSSHTAVTYLERYIVIFGGGSVSSCYNDVVVLDTQALSWIRPEVSGPVPPIRAGHASALLGTLMYMIGGGNNTKGCSDMYSLDLKDLGRERGSLEWVLIGNTPPTAAIASEGLSLTCIPMAGCVLSFGGYNGSYHSAIHVYRPESFVLETLQDLKKKRNASNGGEARRDGPSGAADDADVADDANVADADHAAHGTTSTREAMARLESTALEVDIMRKQLASANKALAEAERVAEAAREALAEEEQKNMQLQVHVSELKKEVGRVRELEREIQRYRLRESSDGDGVKGKRTGFWGYIAGSDRID